MNRDATRKRVPIQLKRYGPFSVGSDRNCLNEVEGSKDPMAENIAIWIWDRTKKVLSRLSGIISSRRRIVGPNTTRRDQSDQVTRR